MEALTRWLRALIFTPGDSPATGAQEGNRTPENRLNGMKLTAAAKSSWEKETETNS